MVALGLLLAPPAARAQAAAPDRSAWVVTVTGEGSATAVPDIAEIRAGVVTQGKTAREASEANSRTMAALLLVLKAAGVPDTDVKTSRFSVQPVYEPNRPPPQRLSAFQANNQVAVTLRDVAQAGDMIDKLAGAGANEFSGISFSVSGASRVLDNARGEAVADARRKAEIYARAAGLSLGRAISITEDGASAPPPMAFRAAKAGGTPIAAGEDTLSLSVTVAFELLR